MNKKKQMSLNMITQVIAYILNLGVSFFITSYVVKYIGKEVYGFVGLANNFVSYLSVVTVALSGMINRFITVELRSGEEKKAAQYYVSAIVANVVLALVLTLPTLYLIIRLDNLVNVPAAFSTDIKILWIFLFGIFLIQLPTNVFGVATFSTNRLELSNLRNMESGLLKVIILFGTFSLLSPHVYYIGIATFICGIYTIILNYYYKKKLTPELSFSIKGFDIALVWQLLKTSVWNSIQQLNLILFTGLDLLLTNLFIGAKEMSLYSIAKTLPNSVIAFVGTIAGTFTAQLTITYAEEDKQQFIREVKTTMKICGFLCAVPIIGLMAFGSSLFKLWIGNLTSSEIEMVQILSVLTVLPAFVDVYVHPLFSINTIAVKLKIPVLINTLSGVLNVVIVFALLKTTNYGVYVIAVVSGILMILKTIIFTPFYSAHILGVSWKTFYWPLVRGIFSNIITLIVFMLINHYVAMSNWGIFIVVCIISGGIGYLINFFIYLNTEEREKVLSFVKRK